MPNCQISGDLDNYLIKYSYIGGYEPTQEDTIVFQYLDKHSTLEGMAKYLHLTRWFCHMKSFTSESRAAFVSVGSINSYCTDQTKMNFMSLIETNLLKKETYSTVTKSKMTKEVSIVVRCGMCGKTDTF